MCPMPNLVSLLQTRSSQKPDQEAFLFLEDGKHETDGINYSKLDKRAYAVATYLHKKNMYGQRVLLLYPSGIDFIISFIGCLYAGAIAVPVTCPAQNDFEKYAALLKLIALDADIAGIFTSEELLATVKESFSIWIPNKKFFVKTNIFKNNDKKNNELPTIQPQTIAYLQYTSGSTSTPKAAIVRHENLIHSLKYSAKVWGYTKNSITLSWAPHTHVYGLVCGLLLPLYHGSLSIILPTSEFIRRPALWLQAISKYRVTHSGCPNFGYDRCVTAINETEMLGVNLKSWKVAINGGENVRYETMKQFSQKFGTYGFKINQFNSAFGMSEVSGAIAVSAHGQKPVCFALDGEALQNNTVKFVRHKKHKKFVGNGRILPGLEIVIVNPETLTPVNKGNIGEIWLSGKSVVSGYWRRQEETKEIFNAKIKGSDQHYFRTGDLGFIYNNEICLTGRLKELIVFNGKKHYPLDIEISIAEAVKKLDINNCQAVFSLPDEKVVVVQEVNEDTNHLIKEKIITTIRHVVTRQYGIDVFAVVLVKLHTIPKTVSGKLQRKLCQKHYVENLLKVVSDSSKENLGKSIFIDKIVDKAKMKFGELVASILKISIDNIDFKTPLSKYSFNSINIIHLTALLNETYGLTISPANLYEFQTLDEFYYNLIARKQTKKKNSTIAEGPNNKDIAIIGISGIFPGAEDVEGFWENLIQNKNTIKEIPANRWSWNEYYGDPHSAINKTNVKWGGFIEDIACFDADFFSISPREAELIDPQQRLFLQVVWKVIEDAGYAVTTIADLKTGLYVGVFNHDYAELLQKYGNIDAYMTTGAAPSMLANRVSYMLNLHGPSEAIDTACSSSLVAIHHAVRAIQNGDCDMAIAGGVNALLTPTSFIAASKAGMLSEDGLCKTFDKTANGFVRGEGVAAVLLKKLDKALTDNDPIYAVIKGSAINHGGHVNTLTAPNPNAQADVIIAAHTEANIPIESIHYVETHGTGTAIGDPIEINGLKKAFHILAERQGKQLSTQFCGLGAVKTNIGHLESAAGIAGLIKVLLSIKHEQIPSNLNFTELNPYIDMTDSPFYLINKLTPWKRSNNATPRRAGISSFGFGGTNAHILLEEPPLREERKVKDKYNAYLITLSAKTAPALHKRIHDLYVFLTKQQSLPSLSALSYTLNVCRMHFDKRCAIVVDSIDKLQTTLLEILQARKPDNFIDTSDIAINEKNLSQHLEITDDLSIAEFKKLLIALAKRYVNGENLEWEKLYKSNLKIKLSLPTYPFDKNRYWIPIAQSKIDASLPKVSLHPLLDADVSTLESQIFTKLLTGKENYLQDHKVNDEYIFPGAAYIEMAHAAASIALPGKKITNLRDINWTRACKYSEPIQLNIKLNQEDDKDVTFTVTDNKSHLYATGKISYATAVTTEQPQQSIDLAILKKQLTKKHDQATLYTSFATIGLHYGKTFQMIQHAVSNHTEALAWIKLQDQIDPIQKAVAHISLLDGALHSAMILLMDKQTLYLPHSLGQITIYDNIPSACYAHVNLLPDIETPTLKRFHIQLSDESGKIFLIIKNFVVREITVYPRKGIYIYRSLWTQKKIVEHNTSHLHEAKPILIFNDKVSRKLLGQQIPKDRIISVQLGKEFCALNENNYCINISQPTEYERLFEKLNHQNLFPGWIIYRTQLCFPTKLADREIQDQLQQSFYALYHLSKTLLKQKSSDPIQLLFVNDINSHEQASLFVQALAGFARTLNDENPNIRCRIIERRSKGDLLSELSQQDIEVRYDRQNCRWVRRFEEITLPSEHNPAKLLKPGAVYLITGGMGALGIIFARYLAKNYQAKLVLTGRTALDDAKKKIIHELKQTGAEAIYCEMDISNNDNVQTLLQIIKKRFGSLNGILHAAGVIHDGFIINKMAQESTPVLAPKINGTINLDNATQSERLDFFVLFSSVTSIFGNSGQCDYAYANSFMDNFAMTREQLRKNGRRSGKTISINWPLWEDGGFKMEAASIKLLENILGIVPLATDAGLRFFQQAFEFDSPQLILLTGQKPTLEKALLQRGAGIKETPADQENPKRNNADTVTKDFKQQTIDYLKHLLSTIIKINPEKLQAKEPFETYGIDSLLIIQLNHQLEKTFGPLPKTLFFEYQNLSALTDYFLKTHFNKLKDLLKLDIQIENIKMQSEISSPFNRFNETSPKTESVQPNDIAIIGLSGRYPKANNVEEFWQNLKSGLDCITEIPTERWDQRIYFDPDKTRAGKSYSKWGGFIEDVDKFDPLFFNISPSEAELIDPQERLFLQTAWNTIEDAGYTREHLVNKRTGVFVGVMYGHYQLIGAEGTLRENNVATNSIFSSIANRVSYYFDFQGPSIALDTMCSSSLTSLHLACQSLRNGECELALAGGVNVNIHPQKYLLLSQGKFLSTDGRCRSFGEEGDGYVPGEGVGAVLLKPLQQAISDGDHIYGVIKGSSINHGGKTNGYTVPNPVAQAAVIAQAYQNANVDPATVSYIEAHGTGTSLGDPIEIAGLSKVFQKNKRDVPYLIGSVKSNIGHCESAAGIAAITKVLMQLKYKTLVPSLHANKLNKNISWETTAFEIQQRLGEWQRPVININGDQQEISRIAGISSFGAGGSNAHVIIEEAPKINTHLKMRQKPAYLLVLSAKTETALQQKITELYLWLKSHIKKLSADISIENISYTLNTGRSHFEKRCAIVTDSIQELLTTFESLKADQEPEKAFINFSGKEKKQNQTVMSKLFNQLIQETVQGHLSAKEYRDHMLALANFYVDGYDLDLAPLHQGESKRKISLPTYPFAKDRYWYNPITSISQPLLNSAIEAQKPASRLAEQVMQNLIVIVSDQLKIKSQDLDAKRNLSDYGMDSVQFVKLASYIDDYYGITFTPALFFTYNSLSAISTHLINAFFTAVTQAHDGEIKTESNKSVLSQGEMSDTTSKGNANEDIAIIGMQGLFPQSKDLETFWNHIASGDDLVTEIPANRWDWRKYYGDAKANSTKTNSKWGAFIDGIDTFDANFFNLSAREANLMDPQQRLFLEVAWKVIEDAGYDPFNLATQKVGVFTGVEFSEYQVLIANQHKERHGYIATGNSHSMIANRVSYFLNLQGPSESIDTACSSSLVAIHRAVNAICNGECAMAIAGGVSLILNPDTYIVTSQLGALSADGRCKTFDKTANGYVKGEGVAAVLLKSLHQAQLDNDFIYGVIKSTAVNHGGKAQSLTAPNAIAQSDLLVSAYSNAKINPASISYIEIHGTGTELGDPVEIEGLKLAFKKLLPQEKKNAYIGLGSVKTNLGHLEPASGIAGVFKVLLAMHHGKLPGNIHLQELNPYIDIVDSPFYVLTQTQSWQKLKDNSGKEIPYRAGISSFGFGGTNAHVVIEQSPQRQHQPIQVKTPYLLTLSAKQVESLKQKIADLYAWLESHNTDVDLHALCFTLNTGRAHFDKRCALVIDSLEHLLSSLQTLVQGQHSNNCIMNVDPTIVANGPVLNEIYKSALTNLKIHSENNQHHYREALKILGDLYCKHYPVEWAKIYADDHPVRTPFLPPYPFVKQRYWFDMEKNTMSLDMAPIKQNTDLHRFTLQYLQNIFADILRIPADQIEIDQTYEVYGVDSIMGLEITERLEKDFGPLAKTLLYERNKLEELSAFLIKHYRPVLLALGKHIKEVPDHFADNNQPSTLEQITNAHKTNSTFEHNRCHDNSNDIAIIGLSGIFPMAKDIDELWQNLISARDCIGEVPPERWNYKDYPVHVGGKEKYFQYGGFISDVDKFDPLFFNISPHDATIMDPQERLFLQSVWTTLEDAGYTREKLQRQVNNEVGVFAGVTYNYYPLLIAEGHEKGNQLPVDLQTFSVANRVSYFLNFSGPSFVIDTACSSSLAAIHLAYESILRGECKMAIAGGVNLSLHPSKFHFLGSFSFLSDNGRCTSFGEGGTGYVPSEGLGTVILKPLSAAIRDNDRIYAVMKSSSMNHGGKTSGYTVPNPNSQAMLIKTALEKAKINPRSISYIEAHGTGTALGDPIEIRGLQDAFEQFTQDKQFCAIGSVKSNIGHLESAAGISQVAKVLLQMRYKKLVPNLHTEKLNPFIHFDETPFYVQQELSEWQTKDDLPRRAGISSFGAGGTNVHLIVEEYNLPQAIETKQNNTDFLLILSAMNAERLQEYTKLMYDYLLREGKHHANVNKWLGDLCYSAQTGRESMTARLAILASSYDDLTTKLKVCIEQSKPEVSRIWINHSTPTNRNHTNIQTYLEQRDFAQLAALWISGVKIPWAELYQTYKPNMIYLPTYPFAKRRCWPEPSKEITQEARQTIKNQNSIAVQDELKTLINTEGFDHSADQPQQKLAEKIKSNIRLDGEYITTRVMNSVAMILGLDVSEIDLEMPFLNYGMDSIIGINFVAELNTHFPDLLSPMDLYRYPNVSQLVNYILSSCEQKVEETVSVVIDLTISSKSESEFLAEIAHLNNAQVNRLLEEELMDLDEFLECEN